MRKNKIIIGGSVLFTIFMAAYVYIICFLDMSSVEFVSPQHSYSSQQYLARWSYDEKSGNSMIQIVGIMYKKDHIIEENDIKLHSQFLLEKDKSLYEFTGTGYDKLEITYPEQDKAVGEFTLIKIRLKSSRLNLSYEGILLKNTWMKMNARQLVIPNKELEVLTKYLQQKWNQEIHMDAKDKGLLESDKPTPKTKSE